MATKSKPPVEDAPLTSAALEPLDLIPHIDKAHEATIRVSLTRRIGTAEITLEKEIVITVATMLDQHREYDKLTQQLEWHIGRIVLERLAKDAPNGQRPK